MMQNLKLLLLFMASCLAVACDDQPTAQSTDVIPAQSENDVFFTLGDATYRYPVITCQIRSDRAFIQASEGMSGYAFTTDVTQTRASFQREWNGDDGTMHEQWDVRRPAFTIAGNTITVSDTIHRTGLWEVLENGMRERVQGVERIETQFTLAATCYD